MAGSWLPNAIGGSSNIAAGLGSRVLAENSNGSRQQLYSHLRNRQGGEPDDAKTCRVDPHACSDRNRSRSAGSALVISAGYASYQSLDRDRNAAPDRAAAVLGSQRSYRHPDANRNRITLKRWELP